MMNQLTITTKRIDQREFDFETQFQRCVKWNDPDEWDALAMLYYQRGYYLNALHCFNRADVCRNAVGFTQEGAG